MKKAVEVCQALSTHFNALKDSDSFTEAVSLVDWGFLPRFKNEEISTSPMIVFAPNNKSREVLNREVATDSVQVFACMWCKLGNEDGFTTSGESDLSRVIELSEFVEDVEGRFISDDNSRLVVVAGGREFVSESFSMEPIYDPDRLKKGIFESFALITFEE